MTPERADAAGMQAGKEPIPASWDEARGPHLPDRLTAVPVLVWPFVALAVLLAVVQIRRHTYSPIDASVALSLGLTIARLLATTLLGAALFLRHPDAWSRLRPVAVGVTLLAIAEALRVLAPVADDLLGRPSGPSDGVPILTVSYLVGRTGAIVGIVGVASLWVGLKAARRTPDPAGTRAILAILLVVGLGILAIGYGRLISLGLFDGDAAVAVTNASELVIEAVQLVAWIAVASVLVAGSRVRERPATAWLAGAFAALAISISPGQILSFLPSMDPTSGGYWLVIWSVSLVATGGAVLLLAAFLLGLPEPGTTARITTGES